MKRKDAEQKKTSSRKTLKERSASLKKSNAGLPAVISLERDAGMGFEGADKDSYVLPFLVMLQTNSPQCDEDNSLHVKKAAPGMFLNLATGELFDGKKGVCVVPVMFQRKFVEWVPRGEGGGFRGSYDPASIDLSKYARDESGKFVTAAGNYLADTRYHYCLILAPDGPQPIVLALTSTQIKKSRSWMTKMQSIKLIGANGKKFTPPTFSHVYRLTSVGESNEKGNWKGIIIDVDHILSPKEEGVYLMAKEFRSQVESGQAKVEDHPSESETEY